MARHKKGDQPAGNGLATMLILVILWLPMMIALAVDVAR